MTITETGTPPPEFFLLREKGAYRSGAPADEPADEPVSEDSSAILCRACRFPVTADQYIIAVNDRHIHTFFNPAGIVFEIRCFIRADGASIHGEPTDEFSWFAGCRWQYCRCAACHSHLGWFFSGPDRSFYGLIAGALHDLGRG